MSSRVSAILVLAGLVVAAAMWVPAFMTSQADPPSGGTDRTTSSGVEEPTEEATQEPAEKPYALFFGDTYVNGSDFATPEESMGYVAAVKLGMRPIISGAGGTGFAVGNADADMPPYLEQIRSGGLDTNGRRPSLIVIEGGLNDRVVPPSTVRANAVAVIRATVRHCPECDVAVVGPVDLDGDFSDTQPVSQALGAASDEVGVPYIDASGWLVGHYDLLAADGVHPTPRAGELLGNKLAASLGRVVDAPG
jgi:GDSL-like Lipase/Acylhydrolase family